MLVLLLCLICLLLALALGSLKKQIRAVDCQLRENRPVRVSLTDRDLEILAADINAQAEREQDLLLQRRHDEEALRQAVAGVSHDLRTPLAAISGYLTLLEETDDVAERARLMAILHERTSYLGRLIDDFYTLSVLEHTGDPLPMSSFDLNGLLTERLLEQHRRFSEQPALALPDGPVIIWANAHACERIIDNLLVNSVRHGQGDVCIHLSDAGTLRTTNACAPLSAEQLAHLFDPFTTAADDPARTRGSGGLGLAIVRELLARMALPAPDARYADGHLSITVHFRSTTSGRGGNL